MKKNAVALSVATLVAGLGFAGAASADVLPTATAADLRVNAGGIGHSLLQPYFTTQNGNVTLLSIVNTDTINGKAVKVRFRGASNSDDLFDFQLYLSPADVWTAQVTQGADGISRLSTTDKSCTLPDAVRSNAAGTAFVLDRLPAFIADRAAQTREGYVEIFNMADIPPGTVSSPTGPANSALYTTIKHANGVPACSGSVLSSLLVNPTSISQANTLGLYPPSTGLFGNYIFVNQGTAATSWSGDMTSIVAVNSPLLNATAALGNIVFFPQTGEFLPNADAVTADPLLRSLYSNGTSTGGSLNVFPGPLVTPLMFDAPDMSTPYLNTNVGTPTSQSTQLSQAIATNSIRNEYLTTTSIDARTDWSLSFPTRRYTVAVSYGVSAAASQRAFSTVASDFFTPGNTVLQTNAMGMPQICVGTRGNSNSSSGDLTVYDREETTTTSGFVISPGAATLFRFCGEVSVLSFNRQGTGPNGTGGAVTSGALRAEIAQQSVPVPYTEGWASLTTSGNGMGLPILGKSYLQATNPTNGNFSTNFGVSYEHRYERPLP